MNQERRRIAAVMSTSARRQRGGQCTVGCERANVALMMRSGRLASIIRRVDARDQWGRCSAKALW